MGLYYNFIFNDPLYRYYITFYEQITYGEYELRTMLEKHKYFMET